ncbi:MAG: hypothetical protein A2268_13490 [Candidatus Raymondbacteria bacterium RifOxyA12_full_50_37]|uniref:Creatininase n=1 Tax=Candidatus Raymondbacteria bacterium RIFOXYD12_FULL_49_13 TaxID=1817890 RepID=A0A1F7F8I4_UNCRA|nr:MAG: hypothetical protein A2268_13490 [Candidatus Raymondbacteria bacterium RifOxyA12_full_50_37]OGJ91518.1 MAG: hypothetical protein A2248_03705 [Candidatus Raymondbacteria bacterium RIFOXYA2_FULL_49_16]OGJ93068.1 MAG: hypothetical protein A2350_04805 [Candidatus Raymondbacteria bacterium RifOxyB12_full_50_8]OGJ97832.1 MAG: hypothetical protein A2453_14090 [Candidatus Raymondbacteria bacterium RIFOXYC2_FULL_50_21]OGK02119.1 MAG: hypothetical protein A2487_20950 [Candidatus Raymondbacteria b
MNWELLTSPEFEKAVKKCGRVCLLPFGVVEKHGDHLPLGMDAIAIHEVATKAAERETAMVFPSFYLGQICEARHVPGTIALRPDLLAPVLENMCDEIGRNGFTKVLIVNGHGGNIDFLKFFSMTMLGRDKEYMLYVCQPWCDNKEASAHLESPSGGGHGGEAETSVMMHLCPEIVKYRTYGKYGKALGRFDRFRKEGVESGIWWYADYPGHFAGDQTPCTAQKGKKIQQAHVNTLVRQIRVVKKDDAPARLYREFLKRAKKPANRFP